MRLSCRGLRLPWGLTTKGADCRRAKLSQTEFHKTGLSWGRCPGVRQTGGQTVVGRVAAGPGGRKGGPSRGRTVIGRVVAGLGCDGLDYRRLELPRGRTAAVWAAGSLTAVGRAATVGKLPRSWASRGQTAAGPGGP